MSDDALTNAVHSMCADDELKDIQSYVERGRALKDSADGDLRNAYLDMMQEWAERGQSEVPLKLRDVAAELSLRKIDPPATAFQYVQKIASTIADNAPEDSFRDMLSEHLQNQKPKN